MEDEKRPMLRCKHCWSLIPYADQYWHTKSHNVEPELRSLDYQNPFVRIPVSP